MSRACEVKVVELVYGWRLIALIDLVTLIPLAHAHRADSGQ